MGAADKNTPNATKDRPPNIAIIPMIIVRIAMIVTPVGLLTFSVKYLHGEGYRRLVPKDVVDAEERFPLIGLTTDVNDNTKLRV